MSAKVKRWVCWAIGHDWTYVDLIGSAGLVEEHLTAGPYICERGGARSQRGAR